MHSRIRGYRETTALAYAKSPTIEVMREELAGFDQNSQTEAFIQRSLDTGKALSTQPDQMIYQPSQPLVSRASPLVVSVHG